MKPDFPIDLARIVLATAALWAVNPATWALSNAFSDETPGRVEANGDGQFVVQIVGRFCQYQRHDVEVALGEIWSVSRIEFLNDHGTLRLFFDSHDRTRTEVAKSVERALSLGWFCSAHVDPDANAEAPVRLVEIIR
jgi:hypothetical protein